MSVNYRRCYEVLQLKTGTSWEDVRKQYKRLAQHCHPDRYQGDADALRAAEAKLRELNAAYKILADYHRRHKRLPLGGASSHTDWQFQDTSNLREREEQLRVERRWSFLDLPVSKWMVFAFPGGVILLVIVFLFSHSDSDSDGDVEPMVFPQEVAPSKVRGEVPVQKEQPFFSYGDTWKKIVDVQGEPTAISGNTWFYGKSRIFFEDGHVVGWEHDSRNPLLAKGRVPGSEKDGERRLIYLGDTKEDVLEIQGKPLMESDRRWDYGPSFIEFRDGKVVRWHSSVLRPLAVAEPDARAD
jgi:hypothetical protein